MRCSKCGHVIIEEKAKFCSDCGSRLHVQPPLANESQPQPLVADFGSEPQTSPSQTNDQLSESKEGPKSPKRSMVEEPFQKKKKRKKKSKKKKDGHVSSDRDQAQLNHPLTSLEENQEQKMDVEGDSSDSDSSVHTTYETADFLGTDSSMEHPPTLLPTKKARVRQRDEPAATTVESATTDCKNTTNEPKEDENRAEKAEQDQTPSTRPSDSPALHSDSKDSKTLETNSKVETESNNPKDQKSVRKNSTNKQETITNCKSTMDDDSSSSAKRSEEVKEKQTKPSNSQQKAKAKNEEKKKQEEKKKDGPQQTERNQKADDKSLSANERKWKKEENQKEEKDVDEKKDSKDQKNQNHKGTNQRKKEDDAGSSSKTSKLGSSDDQLSSGNTEAEKSEGMQEVTSTGDKSCEEDGADAIKANEISAPPPKKLTNNRNIAVSDKLTIYFHAILSKDFKFNPDEDQIFIRVGSHFGTWKEDAVELFVSRDIGKHGYLVEGSVTTKKSDTMSESIPYKYIVYKHKKKVYEYEFIYTPDSSHHTNRCLFVKPRLLTADGDWHQYDDIICAQPSTNRVKQWILDKIWSEQRKDLVQGREIAGNIMLETIFDILRSWSETNLNSFQTQLQQFFEVYSNPYVYEERGKKWSSLNFGEIDVKKLLKEFTLTNLIPHLRDEKGGSGYLQDPLKAAVIMLHVWNKYKISLSKQELHRLCTALCLPKMEKEAFLHYWSDFSQAVSAIRSLPDMLLQFIKSVKADNMPRWIVVLPLLHLTKDSIKPYEAPPTENTKYNMSWAGLQGLDLGNISYIGGQQRKAIFNVLKEHSFLTEIDALLVRSFLYLIPVEELVEYTGHIRTELLDFILIVTNKIPTDITSSCAEAIIEVLSHIHQHVIEEKCSPFTETYRIECLTLSVKLLDKICKGVRLGSYTQNFPDVPVTCMSLVASVFDFIQRHKAEETLQKDEKYQHVKDLVISQAMGTMRKLMTQTSHKDMRTRVLSLFTDEKKKEIELWNSVISITFNDEEFTRVWRQTLTMDFEDRYKQETSLNQVKFYCTNIEDLSKSHPHVAASVEKCALEAVTSLCQTRSEGKLFENMQLNWKFWKLISKIIEKSWPIDCQSEHKEEEEAVLQHLLSWTAAKDIFQLHGREKNLFEHLSEDAKVKIVTAISSFTTMTQQLINGDIKIRLLNVILERRNSFTELLKIDCLSEGGQCKDCFKMKKLLERREKEKRAVYHEKKLADIILMMSHKLEEHMTVDVADLEEKAQTSTEGMPLNGFMEVYLFDKIDSEMTGVVTFFELDEDIREMAEELLTFQDSYVFKLLWEKFAKILAANEREDDDDPDEDERADIMATPYVVCENIFKPCFGEYKDICTCLKNGKITLREVDQLFKAYKGKHEDLTRELNVMSSIDKAANTRWIDTRVEQIEQFHELHLAVTSAQIIMRVKNTLGLRGDFRVLETLTEVLSADFQNEPLSRIDNELMQAKMVLVDITEPRLLCLKELAKRGNFVRWVKDALEDINELKVFVDLASISAGENDMDVDRVACFHDAVLGYSSLLYELKADAGFRAFKEVLKKVWKALENDKNLSKKLCDTARHLEWLKTVKDSHGSVELSSLSLASAINQKGIYLISAQGAKKLNLDSALKLQIPEKHEDGCQMRCYSLEDLRELQNKLMLMSGKGDQGQNEVDRFAEIFASAQRLAEAFIALYAAGNPLFRNWEAQINCAVRSPVPIIMDFHLERPLTVIVEGNVEEQLPELCKKIETCLNYWMNFVDKQRAIHYYLNYFTAEQIVYLCRQLTQQSGHSADDQVFMMLSFIKPNCSPVDLRQAWHDLQYEILTKPQELNEDIEFQTFVVVPRAEDEIADLTGKISLVQSPAEHLQGLQAFDHIWNDYMKDMKNFLPNILDIKNLGRLLGILANKSAEPEHDEGENNITDFFDKNLIVRQLPKGLTAGNPNLIVCPYDDVLTSCVSIYMSSSNEPLPTYDEVLLCSPSTTYEQVELFFRRCLSTGYNGQKVYTLLYGDLLTYDVSSKVEHFFQQMKLQSRKDYRLVIICSSEREHAYLPSAFSQHKLHMVPQEPLLKIQNYLQNHYTVALEQSSAAAVFKDRLCVGVISSKRAGVGKSLYIRRLYENLKHSTKEPSALKCIRLTEPTVDETVILQELLGNTGPEKLTMFHFDVTSSVKKGLHEFLFKLLVLRYMMDAEGKMWRCNEQQLYLVEILEPTVKTAKIANRQVQHVKGSFTGVFPNIYCRPPKQVWMLEIKKQEDPNIVPTGDPLMDDKEFRSEAFQRPYQYLTRFHNRVDLDTFMSQGVEGTHAECLQMLLMFCGIMDPSWAELRNFAWFLNLQLKDCETSVFCDATFTGDTLRGFKTFVVNFMILMAKDFATPSLSMSDQSPGRVQANLDGIKEEDLAPFLIRKRWETEPHPYIFFNDDHNSMTFIGFHLQLNAQNTVDAIEPISQRVIKRDVMTRELFEGLMLQRVPFNIDFDSLPRWEKIERLCNVLGIQWPLDPDETYELTTDNILKMLAIHMRFRCGIPVIIMGETGCGKTRLVKFLCELRKSGVGTENMKLVKVHGGTTSEMIYAKVKEAENIAYINKQDYGFNSVLFFDEANTTEAVSSIKEVLCDKTVKGKHLTSQSGLQIIAACNPYRKHTDEMIQRLESAGLGYKVRADETDEKLGSIPLRQLVYRVHALPPSMIPLVWDFGQLNDQSERIYIHQIVQRVITSKNIKQEYITYITDVLSASQKYMRMRNDECSFVSLRDVERCMQAFVWFYDNHKMLFLELEKFENNQHDDVRQMHPEKKDPVFWSLVLATGVCYHACLENKDNYRSKISNHLPHEYNRAKIMQEISLMQDLLLSGVPMGDTIARNSALKENVFMMVLCIELRIPLFLVGKPGSSKSLSKTLVADAMQGQAAHSELYKMLKQVHLVSFQCSPHSTPEGIINTFKQCGRFQEGKNLNEYISVVVLDEIGLAEDSPKMPLKTLHPLLEEGCIDDEPLPHKKVGFIGISNWALDPAKMNRGIFVSRGDPDEKELIESAKGICSSDDMVLERVRDFFQPFSRAYLSICQKQETGFFGLRDFYSLIKMIFALAKASQQKPNADEIVKAVLRNFSGRDDVDAVSVFTETLHIAPDLEAISTIEFVRKNIEGVGQEEECRYLLVLTKNYAALQILQQMFFVENDQPEIIFGSGFPKDQEYTQICRNINRVKICMETGRTVVLLNLQNLYESLYDALNQYYVYLGGQKYVDLGLGTHRVKCRVHKNFRLIVIEEREVVYKQFPIPLINRLEKHYLDIQTVLKTQQKRIVEELQRWVKLFATANSQRDATMCRYQPADVFIGYHSDTCASVILQVMEEQKFNVDISDPKRRLLEEAKLILLKCATPDSVVRLDCAGLPKGESEHLSRVYFEELRNSCLADFLLAHTRQENQCMASFTEVTTFSRLLTAFDLESFGEMSLGVELLSLQQFDTEYSFLKKIRNFLTGESSRLGPRNKILLIQCDFDETSRSANLIASAKYSSINEINKTTQENPESKVFVYFITRLSRMEGGTSYIGFHGGPWRSVHIDDLRRSKDIVSDIKALQNMTISQMFETKDVQSEEMEIEDVYAETEPEEVKEYVMEVEDANTEAVPKEVNENILEVEDVHIEIAPKAVKGNTPSHIVDTTALLKSCVQSAVAMLRDRGESGFRSTQRVEILLTLLSESDEIKGEFLKTVKKRLHSVLVTRDGNAFSTINSNWVLKEASNIDALQEGGTFRHTLWKRVQAVVVPLLAQMISIIDRDQNMNLLLDENCPESVKRFWLKIFSDEKLLDLSHLAVDFKYETREIVVQNYMFGDRNVGCSMPFSWRIKDFLDELWVHALHHEGQTRDEFVEFFWKTPLGRNIADLDPNMQLELYQRYLQDFISMSMNITCYKDMQLLCSALNCCVSELEQKLYRPHMVHSLPWVHCAYHEFKSRLQNLSRMMCLEPQVTNDLLGNHHARDDVELVLDVYVAFACLEHLEPTALETDAQRQTWLRKVKKLQVPIELICSEDTVKHYGEKSKRFVRNVQSRWNRIFSLSLFVEHMLLGVEELEKTWTPLLLEHTRRLGQMLEENSDLKTQQAFEAVIHLLKACKDKMVEQSFRFGCTLCPVCMGDPQDPLSLPCGHIYCVACIKLWLVPDQMYCPLCMNPVNDDFPTVPSEEIRNSVTQHAQFRKQCNAFFIDLVSTMCFKDNTPPCPAVIESLLSFLMVETNPVAIFGAPRQKQTKILSPFDDTMDKNPVVRSVVLKLLLKYSFDDVKKYLQRHLTEVEQSNLLGEKDKTELYCLYINCLEDSMFERLQFSSNADKQAFLKAESDFLVDFLQSHDRYGETATVKYLQQLAQVRMDLDTTANLIVEHLRNKGQKHAQDGAQNFLNSMRELCRRSGNDWYRVYLIRKISSQHGVEFVQKILNLEEIRWVFPEETLQKNEETTRIDQFLVYGEAYQAVREAVARVILDGKVDGLEEACEGTNCQPHQKTVHLLLALYREMTTLYSNPDFHPKDEQINVFVNYINSSKILASPKVKAFAVALVTNKLGPFTVRPGVSASRCVLTELTGHLAAVLLSANNGILTPLQRLAATPATMQAAFLPTMPEDNVAVARQALGLSEPLRWYTCQNGHPCTIGECGRPVQESRCLDCGAPVGGVQYRPVQGFQDLNYQGDRTQPGHILGSPKHRDKPDMLDTKNMSPVPFFVVRMLTHMALLVGVNSDAQSISAIINPAVEDPGQFLFEHLEKDLKHLIRSLGKGTDDTICAIHLLISSLLEPHQLKQWPIRYDIDLSSKDTRNAWDMEMSNGVIAPQLKNLERRLKEVNKFIRSDLRISANPVMKLVFGDPKQILTSLHPNSLIHCSAVWSCRQKVSLMSLTHILEQTDGKDTLPVLWRFLHREAEIRLVKHLPDILTLQKTLVKSFQNVPEMEFDSIATFLQNQRSGSLKNWYKKHIKIFLTTWNQLRVSLVTNGEIKIPAEFCQADLDINSDFKVLLPRRQGAGLCSTALVSYLIAVHNDLIYCVDRHTGEETSFKVSPADLTELHVIHYELERDLMPVVLSNTQYSIQKGQETLHEYNLPKIQQQIISRFLMGKPLLTLVGIPTLVNRHERNYEIIFKDVKAKVKQEPLQSLALVSIAGELQSYSEVCEALSTLEVALGFLAMTGGDPHMQLSRYLEEVLQMGNQMAQHILKTLSMCCLKHCVALWQLLASLKSENILRLKRDPFVGVLEKYKQPLGEDEQRLLTAFLSTSSADSFLLEMHEFLVLKLKDPNASDTYRPEWGLKETLVPYVEGKDLDIPQDVEELFPNEIYLSHYVEAWKFIVSSKQEHGQRQ